MERRESPIQCGETIDYNDRDWHEKDDYDDNEALVREFKKM